MRSLMISYSKISSMPLVSSNLIYRCSYCPVQSLPSFLYSSLMLLNIFNSSQGLSKRWWNLPSLKADDLHIWSIIWVRSASKLHLPYFFLLAPLCGSNVQSHGWINLSVRVLSKIYERQLASSKLCTLISPYIKLLNFLSQPSILKIDASQIAWYSQKTKLGTMGVLKTSSSQLQYSSSSYSWWIFSKLRGLTMQKRRITQLQYSDTMQLVNPDRYYRMVRQLT